MNTKIQNYSPESLRQSINGRLERLITSLSQIWNTKLALSLAAVISVLYLSFFYFVTINTDLNNNRTTFFEVRYFWLIPLLVPVVLLGHLLFSLVKLKSEISMIFCFFIVFFSIPIMLSYSEPSYIPQLVWVSHFFVITYHLLFLILTRKININTRILLFFVLEFFIVNWLAIIGERAWFLQSFWITQPYRYIFFLPILSAEMAKNNFVTVIKSSKFISYFFNPTNFITPLPIDYRDWVVSAENKRKLKVKACLYLFFGLLALIVTFFIQKGIHFFIAHYTGDFLRGSMPRSALAYLHFFTFSYANICIPVALAWWFGFQVPEAYDLPLLATSPQERWRRWNTLFYAWYFRFVFFPIYKKTKSQFWAIFFVFAATLFVHLGSHNADGIVQVFLPRESRLLYRKIIFFSAHGLVVYLGILWEQKRPKSMPNPHKISGWWGVLGMFLLMSAIHSIFTQ